ncbi:MAG: hypothetical protein H0V30_14125 [Chitinophagaceae bacterium]|jgi:hypothetical protein|nr:hypothetical protein [Chitinophagaceae bacterium]
MKKTALFILTLSYLLFTSGLIINSHYCMNRLSSMELFSGKSDICSQCGMDNNDLNDCCHDETTIVKLQDDHFASYHLYKIKSFTPVLTLTPVLSVTGNASFIKFNSRLENSPPDNKHPVYLVNRVFRV